MSMEAGLYSFLKDDADVAALVGTRIYPDVAPTEEDGATVPYIVYQRISTPRIRSLAGPSGLATPRFQVVCWSDKHHLAVALAKVVRECMDGYTGAMGAMTVQDCLVIDESAMSEPSVGAEERKRRGVRLDMIIWHEE